MQRPTRALASSLLSLALPLATSLLGLALLLAAGPAGAAPWLVIDAPPDATSTTSLALVELRGSAGERARGTDLVIAIDLSESTLHPSGIDLDRDAGAGTDPALLAWLATAKNVPAGLLARLRDEVDFDDTILAAELEASEILVARLNPRRFRVGLLGFSDDAEMLAEPAVPRAQLLRALTDLRHGFAHHLRGTNLAAAIDRAHKALVNAPPRDPTDDQGRERVLVVLTDGAPTLPPHDNRAEKAAIEAALQAGVDGVRIFVFTIGKEGEAGRDVAQSVARWSGGRAQHIADPSDAALVMHDLDLADLVELHAENATTGQPARALRIFPDGSFDALMPLAEGENTLVVRAKDRAGITHEVKRTVTRSAGGMTVAEQGEAKRLLEALRTRTAEMEAFAELKRRREQQKLELELEPVKPGAPSPPKPATPGGR